MRCGHERMLASAWVDGGWFAKYRALDGRRTDRLVCADCGEWLPLGPATDTADTAIEVRAAEIALSPPTNVLGVHRSKMSDCHLCGYGYAMDIPNQFGGKWEEPNKAGPEWHAGYLAHHIANGEE